LLQFDLKGFNFQGLLETIYLTDSGIFFNADIIFKSLRTDTLLDLLNEYKNNPRYKKDWQERFTQAISNTIIICRYNNRNVYINGVDFKKTPQSTFEKSKGNSISYLKYFTEHYNCKISDKNQPLLISKKKDSDEINYYVPELCFLTGLTEDMRNDRFLMKDLKQIIGLKPDERMKQICSFVKSSLENKEFNEALDSWEFKLDEKVVSVPGRVLPIETIYVGNKKTLKCDESRQWNIRSDPIFKKVNISNWICIFPEKSTQDCDAFLQMLFKVSKPLDINMDKNSLTMVKLQDTSPDSYKKAIVSSLQKNTSFVLVLLADDNKGRYDTIKKLLTIDSPVPSQCVKWKTIIDQKSLSSKATKIAVQIASKMGGIPWALDIKTPPATMICGMDVYHSGETVVRSKPSIVGFTATMDTTMTNYYSRVLINKPGQELTNTLAPIFTQSLIEFKERNSVYPKYIIFYRDGVGEGQLKELLDKEVKNLEKCFATLKMKDPPKITFMVVLKRIHTRLFSEVSPNTFENPLPGTVVDTGIVNNSALEFFLVSQNVNQGTATPTRYQCIYNTANLGIDYLETLTFKLCHLYFNWFGSLSFSLFNI
jgi:aubergine